MWGKPYIRTFLLLCYVLAAIQPLRAQYFVPYKQFKVQNGLPGTHINRLYQGRQGFLWISTDHGLSRFDGLSFRNYGLSDGLTSLNVYSVVRSKDSTLWICTRGGGLHCMKNGQIWKYKPKSGQISNNLVQITQDSLQRIWIMDENYHLGLLENDRFVAVPLNEYGIHKVYAIQPDQDNSLLMGTDVGLFRWDKDKVKRIPLDKGPLEIYSLVKDRKDNLYCGSKGIIYKLGKDSVSLYTMPAGTLALSLVCNGKGELYGISSNPGLFRIARGRYQECGNMAGLEDALIDDIVFDNNDNLHVGTFGRGLYTIFSFDIAKYTSSQGLVHDNITAMQGDKEGRIWIGSYGGVNLIEKGMIRPYPAGLSPDEMATSFLEQGRGMRIGSALRIHRFDNMLGPDKNPGNILCMLQLGDSVLLGTWNGIRTAPAHAASLSEASRPSYPGVARREIHKLFQDSRNRLWVGTDSGLYECDKGKTFCLQEKDGLPYLSVNDIAEDASGRIWAATENGLGVYDGNKWLVYSVNQGLRHNDCGALLFAHDGTLWIGTMAGLNYIRQGKLYTYSTLPKTHITCLYEDNEGKVWAGTDEGLFSFKPQRLEQQPDLRFYVMRVRLGNNYIYHPQNLTLPFKSNNLQLQFLAIDFRTPEDIVYEYRIAGRQKDWQETTNRSLQFSELSPGEYPIELRAKYRGTSGYSLPVITTITILKPFYAEWWFLALVALALGGLILVLVRRRIRKIKIRAQKRAKRISRMMQLRQQAMNALVNPHFIFNSLNSIQHFINQSDNLSANRYLTRFARLIRKTMDTSGKIYISLEDEIERLQLYLSLEKMRLRDKLEYEISVDDKIATDEAMIPSLLVQPYVENAIWHGIMPKTEGGNVHIRFSRQDDMLKITIEDDGLGIKKNAIKKPNPLQNIRGMEINQKRLNLMGRSTQNSVQLSILNLMETEGRPGTRVELLMPYIRRNVETASRQTV